MSAGVGFIHEAPEKNSVDDEGGWRMQEVVTGYPPGVVEIGWMNDVLHQIDCILLENEAVIKIRSPRQQAEGNIGQYGTPQESRFSESEFCAKFLFDGGVDNKMSGEGIQRFFRIFSNLSTDGLSVGS